MRFFFLATALTVAVSASAVAQSRAPVISNAQLKPIPGGVVLQATLTPRSSGDDALTRVFTAGRKASLLHCTPRCRPALELPVSGTVDFGPGTPYRVIIGGKFQPGQKLGFILGFRGGNAAFEAVVTVPESVSQ